jgi:DNA repair protein RadD
MRELRTYQNEAIESLYSYFENNAGNPLVVIPTGGGKSAIAATFMQRAIKEHTKTKILYVVHVKELVMQTYMTLRHLWPDAPATIYSAGLGKKNMSGQIVFASIQSIYDKGFNLQNIDLVIVDEAHLIPHSGDGMYRRLMNDLRICNKYIKVIGLTATPYRMSSGSLTEWEDALFSDICYEKNIAELIEDGYLARPISKSMDTGFDVSGVKITGGDFQRGALEKIVDDELKTRPIIEEIISHGHDRKSWLVFCTGIGHAKHVRDALELAGISAGCVTGKTTKEERDRVISDYKLGKIRALTNADILTTGFDAPRTDLLAVIRPTQSPGLWVQIVGRGMRIADGKSDCLILDFGNNILRHGPIDGINIKGKNNKKLGTEAPYKTCTNCKTTCHAAIAECAECGFIFPPPVPELQHKASDLAVLSSGKKPTAHVVKVLGVKFLIHYKDGSKFTMRVKYNCGLTEISEWVCPEHVGVPRMKFMRWWAAWGGANPIPLSTKEAVDRSGELRIPYEITATKNGKYYNVIAYEFNQPQGVLIA